MVICRASTYTLGTTPGDIRFEIANGPGTIHAAHRKRYPFGRLKRRHGHPRQSPKLETAVSSGSHASSHLINRENCSAGTQLKYGHLENCTNLLHPFLCMHIDRLAYISSSVKEDLGYYYFRMDRIGLGRCHLASRRWTVKALTL